MTELTPMKRLKENFKYFKANVNHLLSSFTLNKGEPKYDPYGGEGWGGYSKGVDNDHTLIFYKKGYPTLNYDDISISFVFDYKDKPLEEVKIYAQMKKGSDNKDITSSEAMAFVDFRLKLNEINKVLKSIRYSKEGLNDTRVFEEFSRLFLNQTLDLGLEVKEAQKQVKAEVENEKKATLDALDRYSQIEKELEEAEKSVIKSVARTKETKEIAELKQRLIELEAAQKEKKRKFEEKKNIPQLKQDLSKAKRELDKEKRNFQNATKKALSKHPNMIQKRIKV